VDPGHALYLREIATHISESLARFGIAGDVYIQGGNEAVLEGSGPRVTAALGTLLQHWELLPNDERQRRCGEIARRLAEARRFDSAAPGRSDQSTLPLIVWAAGIAVLLLAGIAAFRVFGPRALAWLNPPVAPSSANAPLAETADSALRGQKVCDAAASRALRGATLGIADAEGWQVDIALLRPAHEISLIDDPALARFVQGPSELRRLVWPGARALLAVQGAGASLELEDLALPPTLKPRFRGLTVTFSGRFVTPYFNEATRSEYMQLAHAMSEEFKAEFAGLFAHCVGSKEKHAGSWFQAPNPALAATALIYFMGVDAAIPHLRQDLLRPSGGMLDYAVALSNVEGATHSLAYEKVRSLIGTYGGSISGPPTGPTALIFDFKDSSRAARASRESAMAVGLSDGR